MRPASICRGLPLTLRAMLGAVLGVTVASGGVSLLSPSSERNPCRGPASFGGRGGSCALHCMWSSRLCRMCCAAKLPGEPAEDTTHRDDRAEATTEPTWTEPATDHEDEHVTTDGPNLVFPDQLPEGTQEAMLETAAHILAIVSREDSVRIRIWVESPERNLDNIDRLAGKLASFPRAPFGRAYWRLVLRASKDRPFTLLREALAVRAAYLEGGAVATTPEADAEQEAETVESWRWRQLEAGPTSTAVEARRDERLFGSGVRERTGRRVK